MNTDWSYLYNPSRGTPGEVFPLRLNFSSRVRALTRALARSETEADVSHTVLFASGPFTQSGKRSAATGTDATASKATALVRNESAISTEVPESWTRVARDLQGQDSENGDQRG